MDFINNFASTNEKLGELVEMTPRFVYWRCMNCDSLFVKRDCFGNGKYCAFETT